MREARGVVVIKRRSGISPPSSGKDIRRLTSKLIRLRISHQGAKKNGKRSLEPSSYITLLEDGEVRGLETMGEGRGIRQVSLRRRPGGVAL